MQNFIYKLPNKELLFTVFAVIFTFIMVLTAYVVNIPNTQALNTCATGWRVSSASRTINCSGECRSVSKTSGLDFFVGTKTLNEWASFISNPPSNASLSTGGGCVPPSIDGLRWRCHYTGGGFATTPWVCGTGTSSGGITYATCLANPSISDPEVYCSTLCNNTQC